MEKCDQAGQSAEAIAAFDALYTTNHMQMLKLLSPYLDMESRHKLAMLIKWQELMYTMNFMHRHSCLGRNCPGKKEPDLSSLLPLLSPYCSEREKSMLIQFSQIQGMMNTYKDMAQYLPLIQEMMGNFTTEQTTLDGSLGGNPTSMMDMLKTMLSPEQQDLFSVFMEGGTHDP